MFFVYFIVVKNYLILIYDNKMILVKVCLREF